MPTIAIVSQKGGSGKTTLALHLATFAAYQNHSACVIDTDPQATAAAWGDWRGGDFQPEVVTSPPARLAKTIQKAVSIGVEWVVIDTPPHADSAAMEAVKAADLVLVPTRIRAFDLHSLEATAALVNASSKPTFIVLNAVPARATNMIAGAIATIEGLGLKPCPVRLGERAAFHRASAAGEVATESEPGGRASGEIAELWSWACEQLDLKSN